MDHNGGGAYRQHPSGRSRSVEQPRRERAFDSPQARVFERAGLVGAWLEAALRSDRAQLMDQIERQHAAIVAGLEAKLESQDMVTAARSMQGAPYDLQQRGVGGFGEWATSDPAGQTPCSGGFAPVVSSPNSKMPAGKTAAGASVSGALADKLVQRSVSKTGSPRQDEAQAVNEPVLSAKKKKAATGGIMTEDNLSLAAQIRMRPRSLKQLIEHPLFETCFAFLIVLNALVMACEVQYKGLDNGYYLNYRRYTDTAESQWPGARAMFEVLEVFFGVCFTFEVVIKVFGYRTRFVCSLWNLFDATIIILWLGDALSGVQLGMNPMILRLARLAKVLRMVRVVKFMNALDTLQLLISSIQASVSILIWATVILGLVMVTCAMIMNYMLIDFMTDDPTDTEAEIRKKQDVYKYFGTFSRAMLTMVELTLQNPFPCCRMLVEEISEVYGLMFIFYKIVVGFAVVKVITGVFMHETFKVASTDDELMIIQKERLIEKHTKKMHTLFAQADLSGNGVLSMDEFRRVMTDQRVKTWLGAMELDVSDSDLLFSLIDNPDDGNTVISASELVQGVARLKGTARSIDMAVLMREMAALKMHLDEREKTAAIADNSNKNFSSTMSTSSENSANFGAIARETQGLRDGLTTLKRQMGELLRASGASGALMPRPHGGSHGGGYYTDPMPHRQPDQGPWQYS